MSVEWSYFNKFEELSGKYLPSRGEGNTKATQIVTAICKLVHRWYNDGDVYDNTHYNSGGCNYLSSYANWLDKYTEAGEILNKITTCRNRGEYENLLKELADTLIVEDYLAEQNKIAKIGTIYKCEGCFKFEDYDDEEEDW